MRLEISSTLKFITFYAFLNCIFSGDEGNAYSDVWRPRRTPGRQALPRPHYFFFFPGRPRVASSLSGSIRAFPDPATPKRDCALAGVGRQPVYQGLQPHLLLISLFPALFIFVLALTLNRLPRQLSSR